MPVGAADGLEAVPAKDADIVANDLAGREVAAMDNFGADLTHFDSYALSVGA